MNHSLIHKLLIATILAGVFIAFASVSTSTAERAKTSETLYVARPQ